MIKDKLQYKYNYISVVSLIKFRILFR